ncbi:MAG: site-specific integrase [Thiomicrorhabdus sp.]|nr:site-specific integrase [Thiomicrorhabdus sp.]
MSFSNHLTKEGFAKSTIREHLATLRNFKTWCVEENLLEIEQLTYRDLLGYVQAHKHISPQTMNLRLNTLTKYYEYLIENEIRESNPVRRLRVKTMKTRVTPDILKPEELITILKHFQSKTDFREQKHKEIQQRNTLILSLIIHQGADATVLKRLRLKDINFDKGTIFIPGSKRSNERELKLKASQIIPLHTYVIHRQIRKDLKDERLFDCNINNTLTYILRLIKKDHSSIRNIAQLRASVISGWLKRNHLRRVQYMAGHRFVSSTEKYQQQDIEHLKESLQKFHPLG